MDELCIKQIYYYCIDIFSSNAPVIASKQWHSEERSATKKKCSSILKNGHIGQTDRMMIVEQDSAV